MNKKTLLILGLVLLVGLYFFMIPASRQQAPANPNPMSPDITGTPEPTAQDIPAVNNISELIVIDEPQPDEIITSPYIVKGRARGSWFFEATFPVTLEYGSEPDQILETFATAEGEWMTEDFVPFTVTLEFPTPTLDTGDLTLHKANPSGLPENDMSVSIPVDFRLEPVVPVQD